MQSVRMVMRRLGNPNKELDILSPSEVSDYIEYQYTSNGYKVVNTHVLGNVKDSAGATAGYELMFILTKDGDAEVASADAVEKVKAKK